MWATNSGMPQRHGVPYITTHHLARNHCRSHSHTTYLDYNGVHTSLTRSGKDPVVADTTSSQHASHAALVSRTARPHSDPNRWRGTAACSSSLSSMGEGEASRSSSSRILLLPTPHAIPDSNFAYEFPPQPHRIEISSTHQLRHLHPIYHAHYTGESRLQPCQGTRGSTSRA